MIFTFLRFFSFFLKIQEKMIAFFMGLGFSWGWRFYMISVAKKKWDWELIVLGDMGEVDRESRLIEGTLLLYVLRRVTNFRFKSMMADLSWKKGNRAIVRSDDWLRNGSFGVWE